MSPSIGLSSVGPPTAVSSGIAAVAQGNRRLNEDAQQLANPDNPQPIGPLLDLNQARLLTEVGVAILKASNRMLGSLLDVLA